MEKKENFWELNKAYLGNKGFDECRASKSIRGLEEIRVAFVRITSESRVE